MRLTVTRKWNTEKSSIGELWLDGKFECYTLEDAMRPVKLDGKTAIPLGTYEVTIDMSTRFKKLMPHILDVPGFEGIRIHAGNTDADTEGCLLLGMMKAKDFVGGSKDALAHFLPQLEAALKMGRVFIDFKKEI